MGIAKKTDGRYVVGLGVSNANEYKGSATYRDIYIQLTADGATEESVEYLTYLKDYAIYANSQGEPIMPPSVNVWISNNGVTTAVEADDVSIDGNNYTICGIKWNGSTWDYSGAGQGKSGSGLPPYTSADKGKFLGLGEGSSSTTEVIVPEQTVTLTVQQGGQYPDAVVLTGADFSSVSVGTVALMSVNGVTRTVTAVDPLGNGGILFPYGDENNTAILKSAITGEIKFNSDVAGTYTVSLSASVPSVEPKWEAAGGGIFKLSSDMSTGALDKNYTEIKAAITEGLLPVMFSGGSVSIPIVSAVSENNAFNVYGISVRQGALFLIKWSASLPKGPLTPAP